MASYPFLSQAPTPVEVELGRDNYPIYRLFNLVDQYGGVKRITGSGMEVDSCRVVMSSSREASQLQKSLFNQEIFGEILQVDLANLGDEDYNSLDVDLEDGSPSWKLFEDERIALPEVSFAPSKVEY